MGHSSWQRRSPPNSTKIRAQNWRPRRNLIALCPHKSPWWTHCKSCPLKNCSLLARDKLECWLHRLNTAFITTTDHFWPRPHPANSLFMSSRHDRIKLNLRLNHKSLLGITHIFCCGLFSPGCITKLIGRLPLEVFSSEAEKYRQIYHYTTYSYFKSTENNWAG